MRNISGGGIRCSCKRCKNKKFLDPNIVTMHLLQKEFIEKYICMHTENHHNTTVKRMVGSTYSSSNMHGVVYDNSNPYRNIVMDAIEMN
jgi:hypothetical protein